MNRVDQSHQLSQRLTVLDQARGIALLAMIIYHAFWDGLQFGLIAWTVDRDMIMQASAQWIAGSFLIISGISLALAQATCDQPIYQQSSFWKRVAIVAAAAMLVSIATFFALPQAPIYFGILHHIALASVVLALVTRAHPFLAMALAALVLIVNANVALPALNHPAFIWWGLGTQAPVTADWVPLFPWLAAGLIGIGASRWALIPWLRSRPPTEKPSETHRDPLTWMGQNSLAIYLIHQPILIGAIMGYQWLAQTS